MAYRETAKTLAKKQAVRQRLLDAAETIVATEGFRGAAVARVAELADAATGTVYRHFESKGELFSEVFRRAIEREIAMVDEALHGPGSVTTRLDRALSVFANRALGAPVLAWALIAEPVDPQVDRERLIYRQTYARLFSAILAEGISSGEIPRQDTRLAGAALIGAIAEALIGPLSSVTSPTAGTEPRLSAQDESAKELVAAIVTFCLQAVLARRHSDS